MTTPPFSDYPAKPKPRTHISPTNADLEALPGYWKGAAMVRNQEGKWWGQVGLQQVADRHYRRATEYEKIEINLRRWE